LFFTLWKGSFLGRENIEAQDQQNAVHMQYVLFSFFFRTNTTLHIIYASNIYSVVRLVTGLFPYSRSLDTYSSVTARHDYLLPPVHRCRTSVAPQDAL
jgi:hypothetical protein